MPLPRIIIAALGLAVVAAPLSATAQQGGAGQDPVVARVDGDAIHRSEVFALANNLPPQYQAQIAQLYPLLVQRLIDFKLAGRAGRAAGLADDEEVKARMAEVEERVIRDVYLERAIDARVTEEGLQARYRDFLAANPPGTEQRARHILLETEEQAREVIAKLDQGADFAALAQEHSTGPSAPQGGDLGYFTDDQMVPEFAAAANALEPGQHSREPTQTQFGWHVIKVEDRRPVAPPSFAEVEQRLREEMSREAVEAVLKDLRSGAQIEILPAGTSMVPAGTAAQ
ncbi:MAG: peptidylprolyl isomerase [Kiloniellaceae bacterium]